jgi:hypothetical protein
MSVNTARHDDELTLNSIPERVLEAVKQDASVSSIQIGVQERIACNPADRFVNSRSKLGAEADALEFVPIDAAVSAEP